MSRSAVKEKLSEEQSCSTDRLGHLAFYSKSLKELTCSSMHVLRECLQFAMRHEIRELSFLNIETIFQKDTISFLKELLEMVKQGDLRDWSLGFLGELQKEEVALCKEIESYNQQAKRKLWLGIHYSGRESLSRALAHMVQDNLDPDTLSEEMISAYLETSQASHPNLILFLNGVRELGDTLTWEMCYSEFVFSEASPSRLNQPFLENLLTEYQERDLRYGK